MKKAISSNRNIKSEKKPVEEEKVVEEEVKIKSKKQVSKAAVPSKVVSKKPAPSKMNIASPPALPKPAPTQNAFYNVYPSVLNPAALNRIPIVKTSIEDEPFEVKAITPGQEVDSSDPVQVSLKIALKPVSLSSTRSQEIPCLVEILSPENNSTERSGIDIICVIDVSGSMNGEKLELVKKTLLFMIKRLDVTDRVCLITFSDDAKQLSGLICMNEVGKIKVEGIVNRMHIEGGTEIIKGLAASLDCLIKRQIPNQVTSIILLTDGVDNNSGTAMARFQAVFAKYSINISTGFVIHTFGYGSDHQADLLNSMADKTNGAFYYIEKESFIPKAFSDCLGEMMSVVADSVQVELTTQQGSIPFNLTKVYSETGDLSFRMPPILSGEKKESIFLINFLAFSGQVGPNHLEFPIKARVSYKIVASGEIVNKEAVLRVLIANESDNSEVELDEDVMINFYRAKCADVLKEASVFGDNNRLPEARNLLTVAAQEFRGCVVAESAVLKQLISDLDTAIPRFADRRVYEFGGKADLKSKMNCHQNKRGCYKNKKQSMLMKEAEEEFE